MAFLLSRRMLGLFALFAALTAAGMAFAGFSWDALALIGTLSVLQASAVAILAMAVLVFDAARFRVFGQLVGVPLSWRAAWDATIANAFFAWITPGSAMAEPATIVALSRHGVPVDGSAVLCISKSLSSMLVILGATLMVFLAGQGPRLHPWLVTPFVTGTSVIAGLGALVVLAARRPDASNAWLEPFRAVWGVPALQRSIARLATLKDLGVGSWALGFFSHVPYYAAFIGTLVVLLGDVATAPAAVVFQGFTYLAPTPGGAGLSEGAASAFFGDVVSVEHAVVAVVLYRTATFYLHILLGLFYLPLIGALPADEHV